MSMAVTSHTGGVACGEVTSRSGGVVSPSNSEMTNSNHNYSQRFDFAPPTPTSPSPGYMRLVQILFYISKI